MEINNGSSQLTAHSSQLTAHSSQLTAHSSQLTAHSSQLTAHSSQLTAHRGFSLVELMVVVAIIAVLAAIAVPAYKNYMLGAQLSTYANIVQGLASQSAIFSSTHGRFAFPSDLGITTAPYSEDRGFDVDYVANPSAVIDQARSISMFDYSGLYKAGSQDASSNPQSVSGCGQYGLVYAVTNITNYGALGWASAQFQCDMWNYNGVVQTACSYDWTDPTGSFSETDNILPGWTLANTGPDYDTNGITFQDSDSYINATCQ